jgi:hypothetical protein
MLEIVQEYDLHRQLFNDIKDLDASNSKDPEQLAIYKCEIPLPTNTSYPEKANYYAFREVLTDDIYYSDLSVYDIDTLVTDQGFDKDISYTIAKVVSSDATYQHTGTIGYVIKATEVADGTNLTTITYTAHDTVVIGGFGASVELRLIELEAATIGVDTPSIPAAVPIIETPVVILPDSGLSIYNPVTFTSTSFAVSGASFDLHTKSHWEIASDAGFVTVIHDSLNDNNNLES